MPTLSYAQLKGVWLQNSQGTAYHTNAWASLMAAIAEAESGGQTDITNPTDNDGTQTSWGLWQISNGTHSSVSPTWNQPATQVKLAIQKLDGQGLTAWGTYDSGAYQAYLSDKTAADTKDLPVGLDAATTGAETASVEQQANCLWGISIGGLGGSAFSGAVAGIKSALGVPPTASAVASQQLCFLSRSQARAIVGAAALIGGGVIMGLGIAWIIKAAEIAALTSLAAPLLTRAAGPPGITRTEQQSQVRYRTGQRAERVRSPEYNNMTLADSQGTSPEFRRQFGTAS